MVNRPPLSEPEQESGHAGVSRLSAVAASAAGQYGGAWARWRDLPRPRRSRVGGCAGYFVLLTLLFIQPLTRLMLYAAQSDLHSHILLVPFITGYLLYIRREGFPDYESLGIPSFSINSYSLGPTLYELMDLRMAPWRARAVGFLYK